MKPKLPTYKPPPPPISIKPKVQVTNLAKLSQPLTEDLLIKTISDRMRRGQHQTYYGPHLLMMNSRRSPTEGVNHLARQRGRKLVAEKEKTLIDTVLQKYDSLQKQSESLVFTFSEYSFCRQQEEQRQGRWRVGYVGQAGGAVSDFGQDRESASFAYSDHGNIHERGRSEVLNIPKNESSEVYNILENVEIVRQTSQFFGLNLVRSLSEYIIHYR